MSLEAFPRTDGDSDYAATSGKQGSQGRIWQRKGKRGGKRKANFRGQGETLNRTRVPRGGRTKRKSEGGSVDRVNEQEKHFGRHLRGG